MTEQEYFHNSELRERKQLQLLFENFFKHNNCSHFDQIPLGSYIRYDALMMSGATQRKDHTLCCLEYKNRSISSMKYSDVLIEKSKFIELYRKSTVDLITFYIVEFTDHIFIFDLQYEYFQFKAFESDPNSFFNIVSASVNQYTPERKREKLVRYLPYHSALKILDKNYQEVSYKKYITNRAKATNV